MSEQQNEEVNVENEEVNVEGEVSQDTEQVDTQQDAQDPAADTTLVNESNTEAVGLKPQEEQDVVPSDSSVGDDFNTLISAALDGSLSKEDREELDALGMGSHFDMIVKAHQDQKELEALGMGSPSDIIAKVRQEQEQANDNSLYEVVGSKESYSELQEWAVSNLSEAEINSFNNAVVKSGDIGLAKLAVEGLQARYQKVNGQAPSKVIETGGTANEASRPYSSVQEYITETMSMKYKQDPEYAKSVEDKRNKSGF